MKSKKANPVADVESTKLLEDEPVCGNTSKSCLGLRTPLVLTMLLFVVYAAYRWHGNLDRQAANTAKDTASKVNDEGFWHHVWENALHGMSLWSLTFVTVSLISIVCPLFVYFSRKRIYNWSGKTFEQCVADGMPCPEITAIIPCFLPNEKDIIEGTIEHVMNNVESPAVLKTIVVYNTPKDMPEAEARLREMERRTDYKYGRQLQVIRVHASKSKAENLNYVLPKITSERFVIYDADHHPDPDSLLRMNQHMWEQGADIVQGSTYIRNLGRGLMARVVDAEFFVLFFGYYPAMAIWTRVGVFGGSNALINREVIGNERFSTKMQTEDIDLSLRLLLQNKKIVFCPEARSGELVPVSFMALYKQRLRWTIGWDQVALSYFRDIMDSNLLTWYNKLFLCHWLYTRWMGQLCGVLLPILHLCWIDRQGLGKTDTYMGILQIMLAAIGFVFGGLVFTEAICQTHHRGVQSVKQVGFVFFYICLGPLCVFWQAFLVVVSMIKIVTGNAGNWVVTVRSQAGTMPTSKKSMKLSEPLLGGG